MAKSKKTLYIRLFLVAAIIANFFFVFYFYTHKTGHASIPFSAQRDLDKDLQ